MADKGFGHIDFTPVVSPNMQEDSRGERIQLHLFVYGILEASVIQGIKQLKMDEAAVQFIDDISKADALLALQSKLKKNPRIQAVAKSYGIPIYATKSSSLVEIRKAVRALMSDHRDGLKDYGSMDNMKSSEKIDALEEARIAVEQVVIPKGEPVELLPRASHIISAQIDLIRKYQLEAERIGKEPDVRLRILPFHTTTTEENHTSKIIDADSGFDNFLGTNGTNGSLSNVDRLPLLPE